LLKSAAAATTAQNKTTALIEIATMRVVLNQDDILPVP